MFQISGMGGLPKNPKGKPANLSVHLLAAAKGSIMPPIDDIVHVSCMGEEKKKPS
jgi:hypothetical protein